MFAYSYCTRIIGLNSARGLAPNSYPIKLICNYGKLMDTSSPLSTNSDLRRISGGNVAAYVSTAFIIPLTVFVVLAHRSRHFRQQFIRFRVSRDNSVTAESARCSIKCRIFKSNSVDQERLTGVSRRARTKILSNFRGEIFPRRHRARISLPRTRVVMETLPSRAIRVAYRLNDIPSNAH